LEDELTAIHQENRNYFSTLKDQFNERAKQKKEDRDITEEYAIQNHLHRPHILKFE